MKVDSARLDKVVGAVFMEHSGTTISLNSEKKKKRIAISLIVHLCAANGFQ